MQTIAQHYLSTNHPIPPQVEQWLETLPLADKILLATAILDQCKPVFSSIPRNHLALVQLPPIPKRCQTSPPPVS